jgi:hypothetical protein
MTATESLAGSTAFQTTLSKHSFDVSDMSDSLDQTSNPVLKKPMKTLSLKPKPFNFNQQTASKI